VNQLARVLAGFTICAAGAAWSTAGLPCDPTLVARADRGELGYRGREGDSRCEGFLGEPRNTEEGLELVSLVRGELRFDPHRHHRVRIYAPDVTDTTVEPVRVQAFSLYEREHYRMDAVLPHGRPMIWPVSSVLIPAGLGADEIGVYGMQGTGHQVTFVPLSVSTGDSAPDAAAPILMTLRTPVDLKRMYWRHAVGSADWSPTREIPRSGISARNWITVELPPGPPGVMRVQVHGTAEKHGAAVWLNKPEGVRILRRGP